MHLLRAVDIIDCKNHDMTGGRRLLPGEQTTHSSTATPTNTLTGETSRMRTRTGIATQHVEHQEESDEGEAVAPLQ